MFPLQAWLERRPCPAVSRRPASAQGSGRGLTNCTYGAIIILILFKKGARFMKYSAIVCADTVRLAPYTLTR